MRHFITASSLVLPRRRLAAFCGLLVATLLLVAPGVAQQKESPAVRTPSAASQPQPPPAAQRAATEDAKRLAAALRQIAIGLESGDVQPAQAFQGIQEIQKIWVTTVAPVKASTRGPAQAAAGPQGGGRGAGSGPKNGPKNGPGAAGAKPVPASAPTRQVVPPIDPAAAAKNKVPTFARYEALRVRLDAKVATGEITRAESNQRLQALAKELAVESGNMPANPKPEDTPRYKRKKNELTALVQQGKLTPQAMDHQLAQLRALILATTPPKSPPGASGSRQPGSGGPGARGPGSQGPRPKGAGSNGGTSQGARAGRPGPQPGPKPGGTPPPF